MTGSPRPHFTVLLSVLLALAAMSLRAGADPAFTLSSAAFSQGQSIPVKFTCEGAGVSPPLKWSGVPANARSLVLIIEDPDAPDPAAPKMTWIHWVLYNLPASDGSLPENVAPGALPAGTAQGRNSWGRTGYGGPCPPVGRHRYFFRLYALDTRLKFDAPPTKKALTAAMQGHIVARTHLLATYRKSR